MDPTIFDLNANIGRPHVTKRLLSASVVAPIQLDMSWEHCAGPEANRRQGGRGEYGRETGRVAALGRGAG